MHLYMIIHYIVEENIFAVIVCRIILKISGKQKKAEYFRFKNFGIKIKSTFMIYTDFERILVSEGN